MQIQGGGGGGEPGVRTPLENHKATGFLSNTKLRSQHSMLLIGPSFNGILDPLSPHQLKKKKTLIWTPLTKLSGSAHELVFKFRGGGGGGGGGGGLGQKTCFLTPQLKSPTNKSLNDELHTAEKVLHENGKNMTVLSLDFAQRFVFKDNICVKLNYTTKQIQEKYAVWLES